MDIELIRQDWAALAGRRTRFTQVFYERLFARDARYRAMFPAALYAQMDRMVEMFSAVARFADHADLIRPYLVDVGHAHRNLGIHAADLQNFKDAFIETLAEVCAPRWDAAHEAAWNDAFDDMILPLFDDGLEAGQAKPPPR